MKKRLVWLVECVHGYESGCSFGDCVGGTYEPVEIDYEAAGWEAVAWIDGTLNEAARRGMIADVIAAAIGRDE